VSKLLEHFILSNISPFLGTTDNQFGFKAGHSTNQCSFLLKQTASYFVTHGYKVFKFCRCSSYEVMTIWVKFKKIGEGALTTSWELTRNGPQGFIGN